VTFDKDCFAMKLQLNRQQLGNAMSIVNGVVSVRTPKPILQCVLVDAQPDYVLLSGTDLDVGVRYTVSQVDVETPGTALVNADTLSSIVRELGDETLSLELEGDWLHIRGEGSHFQIASSTVEDFPVVPSLEEKPDFNLPAVVLNRMVEWTLFSCAKENTRYAINGVLFEVKGEKLVLAATDGRRLSRASGTVEGNEKDEKVQAIVPPKALSLFSKLSVQQEDIVSIKMSSNNMLLKASQATICTTLIEGNFPKYEDVIPRESDKKAQLSTEQFHAALRKTSLLTNEESKGVRLFFEEKQLTLSSRAPQQGEATITIPIQYSGEPMEIGFNPIFLLEALRVVRSEGITFSLKASEQPGLLETEDEFIYVVMPVNLG